LVETLKSLADHISMTVEQLSPQVTGVVSKQTK